MSVNDLTGRAFGPYRLERLLGLGAMGAVYRAHQSVLERDVALKVLPSELAARADYQARFNREARIAASLEHPHIVPLYDYGTEDGISYVVMRLLNGGTLAERLNARALSRGSLPSLSETGRMLRQIASALDHAHRKGVVHRDIKPNNIMFDDDGTAYVVDFGIARMMNVTTAITGEQSVFGTPHYMPPEQWRDQTLTPESDQYALAVVIYSMVTGQPPLDAPTPHALMYKHFHEPPPPASSLRDDLPAELDTVLDRALRKTPEERYDTAGAFSKAFDAATASVPARSTEFFTFPLPPTEIAPAPPALPADPPTLPASQSPAALQSDYAPKQPSAPTMPSLPPVQPPVLPRPPVPNYPAPTPAVSAGTPAPRPQRAPRRENGLSPLFAGVGLGLVLLALVVCGGGAMVASQLGVFERAPVETQPVTIPVTEAEIILTAVVDTPEPENPTPTALPMPGDTPVPNIGPLPSIPPGTAIAAISAGNLAQAASMGHGTEPVRGVAFRPDGQIIATGAANGSIYLWDAAGSPRGQTNSGGGVIYGMAYSPDGRWLATAHGDSTVRLWDGASLASVAVLQGHSAPVRDLAFSPDSRMLASASEDRSVRVWDVASRSLQRRLDGLSVRALAVAFSPDSRFVAGAAEDGIIRIWEAGSGADVRTVAAGEPVRDIAFSPGGDRLATAGASGTLRLWDATTSRLLVTLTGHRGEAWALAYSPDGTLLASGGRDNTARIWDAATGESVAVLRGHNGWVLSVAFSADGSRLITGGGDGSARLWDVAAG